MNTKRVLLGVLLVLSITTMSTTATVEKNNGVNVHASFDDNQGKTITASVMTMMNGDIGLIVSQDIRDLDGNPISFSHGWKVLNDEEFEVKNGLSSATLTSSVVLNQYYPEYAEIVIDNLEISWKATGKPETTQDKWNDPYPNAKISFVHSDAIATGSINGASMGPSFYASMDEWKIMKKL